MRTHFYRFEIHSGDDNDNSIGEIIIEAESEEDAFERLPTLDKKNPCDDLEHIGYFTDGDDKVLYQTWTEPCDNPELSESDDNYLPDEYDGVYYHEDYYLRGEYETVEAAQKDRSTYHYDGGVVFLDDV